MNKLLCTLAGMVLMVTLALGVCAEALTCQHSYQNGVSVDEDTHKLVCQLCGEEKEEDHIWDEGVVTEKATCAETGVRELTCTVCNLVQEKIIEKRPHTGTYESLEADGHRFTCKKCRAVYTENHGYSSDWEHDGQNHYHACEDCGYRRDEAPHTPGPEPTEKKSQTCTVCARVLKTGKKHNHTYSETWIGNETGHWQKCSDCDVTRNQTEHEYDSDCDTACNLCQVTRAPSHDPGDWQSDASGHWKACTRCGEKLEKSNHSLSEEALPTCSVCKYRNMEGHKHTYSSAHSHTCICDDTYNGTVQFCEVCGIFPWGLLCVAEAVLFAGILGFVIQRQKKDTCEDELEEEQMEEPQR